MPQRFCILTPDPDYYENWQPMADQYRAQFGEALTFRSWTAPGDLTGFDLILPLLVWGYQRDAGRWQAALADWETAQLPLVNPIPLLRWNTDKAYLGELAARGIAIVPTQFAAAITPADLATGHARFGAEIVIKPAISGGADGTYRLGAEDVLPDAVAGQAMLIQPMMPAIQTEGEYSLFYFGGQFSHAILKRPAAGDFRVQEQFGGRETAVLAPGDARALAEASLAAAPHPALYARVDMVRDADGAFRLMELELIEPALFLHLAADKGAGLAKAVHSFSAA
jgi:glutathione synthase/RimK-type ligase-like ATP-grasp enzyme